PCPPPHPPRRGAHSARQNTLAARRGGAEHGFPMFEYDGKLSRDHVLVLMHDDDVDRTSNGHGPAAAKTFSELAQLDFGSWHSAAYAGEPLPTFAAVARPPVAHRLARNLATHPHPGRAPQPGPPLPPATRELRQAPPHAPPLPPPTDHALPPATRAAPDPPPPPLP
ncbi:glycerophosphodiester phosphodiesterase, partial [Achromobacter ruhlandii]